MSKIELTDTGEVYFHCPGCNGTHRINVETGLNQRPVWGFNGSKDKPTFTPSVLVNSRGFTPKGQADFDAWHEAGCPKNDDGSLHEFENAPSVCHSFVTDGKIQYLDDCTHALKGQTVDLPDWDESESK